MVKKGREKVIYKIDSFRFVDHHSKQTILYLHGWNASYQTLLPLSLNNSQYNELYVDLPGCNQQIDPDYPLTIDDYIHILLENFTDQFSQVTFVVGHSFGGKLAVKLMKYLPNLKGLFLISPALLKGKRGLVYYMKVYSYKLRKKLHLNVKNMGSIDFKQASDVMKKTLVNIVNEDAKKELITVAVPTLLVWGTEDKATPFKMSTKIKKRIKDCEIIPIVGGHFAYLNSKNNVQKILSEFVKEVDKS